MTFKRPPLAEWISWHILGTIAAVAIPVQARFGSVWTADARALNAAGGIAGAYLLAIVVLTAFTYRRAEIRVADVVGVLAFFLAGVLLFLILTETPVSRHALLGSVLLVTGFTLVPMFRIRYLRGVVMLGVAGSVLALSFAENSISLPSWMGSGMSRAVVGTSFYNLLATTYREPFGWQEATGGGLAHFQEKVLLAKGDGSLHLFWWEDRENRELRTTSLPYRVPLNRNEFVRDTARMSNVNGGFFRTADILVQDLGERFRLFASHHHWDPQNRCFTVRVSSTSGSYAAFAAGSEGVSWETLYESHPCLGFKSKGNPFAGYQVGGRLALLRPDELVVAFGDHEFDGVESVDSVPQDPGTSYGKTILLDLSRGVSSIYTVGHRNPQGLHVDAEGNVWLTEHGPKGGDELNLILQGRNYGWPVVTYGTDYTQRIWPLNPLQNSHRGFARPFYAWIPSVGISSVIQLRGDGLPIWKGDLLAGSLKSESIWRMRIREERAVFVERVAIGARIRDILEDREGRLILWTEGSIEPPTTANVVLIEALADGSAPAGATSHERGAMLFSRCAGCHAVEYGRASGIGPHLDNVYQRRIAAVEGYTYSPSLQNKGGIWTEQNLDHFLADPQAFAPGTTMIVDGIVDPAERADLIAYLKTLR